LLIKEQPILAQIGDKVELIYIAAAMNNELDPEDSPAEKTTVEGKTIEVKFVHEKTKCKVLVIMCETKACQLALIKKSTWTFIGPYLIQQ
jgi:hypothetical protein